MVGRGEHRLDLGFECGTVLHPLFVGRKARVLAPFRVPQGYRTTCPDRLTGGADHHITVPCLHALVGCVLTMARALAGRLLVVGEPLGRGPRAETDRGLQERALDEPADAGPLAFVEGGENALRRPHPGADIADRQADRNRRPVRRNRGGARPDPRELFRQC